MELYAIVYQSLIVFSAAIFIILSVSFIAHKVKKGSENKENIYENPEPKKATKNAPPKEYTDMFVEDVEWVKNNIKSYNDPSSRTMPANRYEVINVGNTNNRFSSNRYYYISA